ncbi:hypothetical protein ASH00_12975 [Arthrobacter sp. Soil782]|uniref:hypothetical protein n=1 Tax=Arthrobacter sp. Soil782 TaxID=1736410 RepID=UPI0006FE4766|nr:hypothetical protein [Arthrobacter sp. Soil782]KRF05292.1 hypothetical protein ASH00_12975 [Arthrobacter sp. Soil782]
MDINDSGHVPFEVELVPDFEDPALRVPGAVAAAAIAPSAVLAFMTADDDASPYSDPAALRAGGSGQTYAGVAEPAPEADFAGSFDGGFADGGGE